MNILLFVNNCFHLLNVTIHYTPYILQHPPTRPDRCCISHTLPCVIGQGYCALLYVACVTLFNSRRHSAQQMFVYSNGRPCSISQSNRWLIAAVASRRYSRNNLSSIRRSGRAERTCIEQREIETVQNSEYTAKVENRRISICTSRYLANRWVVLSFLIPL